MLAVLIQKAQDEREELVRAALEATEKNGLDSAIPAGIGRLDAFGNATAR